MKSRNENHHIIDLLFTLALFCVFAASALFVIIIGAQVYRSTVQQMEDNYSVRTSLSYVAEKIRQNDRDSAVSIGELDGCPALILKQEYEEKTLTTYIYEYEGFLRELFVSSDAVPHAKDGQQIMVVHSFAMEEISPSLFHFTSADARGNEADIYVSVKSERSDPL